MGRGKNKTRRSPRGAPLRSKTMGLCLEVDCKLLVCSKQQ